MPLLWAHWYGKCPRSLAPQVFLDWTVETINCYSTWIESESIFIYVFLLPLKSNVICIYISAGKWLDAAMFSALFWKPFIQVLLLVTCVTYYYCKQNGTFLLRGIVRENQAVWGLGVKCHVAFLHKEMSRFYANTLDWPGPKMHVNTWKGVAAWPSSCPDWIWTIIFHGNF